jgi:hypothetical protein
MTLAASFRAFTACLLLLFAVRSAAAAPVSPSPDEAQVIAAMETMYVALTKDDMALFEKVAAPTFYAFDAGKRFTGTALMELIKDLHAAGNVYVWQVTEPEVQLSGDTALITFNNRGSVTTDAGTRPASWLESAYLRKDGGTWRIHFFHSTRVP